MSARIASYLAVLSLVAALFVAPTDRADGCAVAPHHGDSVQIADESAVIIWDAALETEHFIRRASFTGKGKDFGFLVPTPEKPELAEAGDEAFATLADLTKPRVVTQPRPPKTGGGCGCGAKQAANESMAPGGVELLESKRVGRYHADVLKADDAGALSNWLKEHGYELSPQIKEWAEPYVAKKWIISAFKIAPDDAKAQPEAGGTARGDTAPSTGKNGAPPSTAGNTSVSTSAVRMTFHTEHPFFPYREPPQDAKAAPDAPVKRDDGKVLPPRGYTGTPPPPRLLRVYFVSTDRVKGTLGEEGKDWSNTANARAVWANKLQDPDRERTREQMKLPKDTLPAPWWLTEFEDRSSPRPGTDDVYFVRDENQAPVERPPTVQYVSSNLPGCVMCYALALYLFVPALLRRARRRPRA
jgi:hypothetical protein